MLVQSFAFVDECFASVCFVSVVQKPLALKRRTGIIDCVKFFFLSHVSMQRMQSAILFFQFCPPASNAGIVSDEIDIS